MQPKTYGERSKVAEQCSAKLELTIPVLVDDMDDTVSRGYDAWPDRLYVLSADGKVAYAGGRGPWGFKVEDMATALGILLDP